MAFSGALKLTDLNDFITPSQACIKPVEVTNEEAIPEPSAALTQIEIDSSGAYHEVGTGNQKPKKLKTAEISLNDCLACSGCITSAESVLITMQSNVEVLNFLASNPPRTSPSHRIPVLSVSPQSLASLAIACSVDNGTPPTSPRRLLRRVQAFCSQELGFYRTYDITFARHLTLLEQAREFRERKKASMEGEKLPMLSSACPGWVCYAEKTHAEMIPFMSRIKSPQQIMGTLVKSWMGGQWGKTPDQIYHVSVMPCYDKKLEASRQDFYSDVYGTRDVDCVLTTGELEQMMLEKGWNLSQPVPDEDLPEKSYYQDDSTALPELICHPGTSSGSYIHSLIYSLSYTHSNSTLTSRTIRSSDYEELMVTNNDTGEIIFKGAKCYGFRNLQNVVRKVGKEAGVHVGKGAALGRVNLSGARGRRKAGSGAVQSADDARGYDYVEVMACPGGCVNGGGQTKTRASKALGGVTDRNKDEEGYQRDWALDGVEQGAQTQGSATNSTTNYPEEIVASSAARWGDKNWTKRVEKAYWHGLPSPPASPPLTPQLDTTAIPPRASSIISKMAVHPPTSEVLNAQADTFAVEILQALCDPSSPSISQWSDSMSPSGEVLRQQLFRTQFRAVNSDVLGLSVTW